jgi:hypothetical protein
MFLEFKVKALLNVTMSLWGHQWKKWGRKRKKRGKIKNIRNGNLFTCGV